MYILLTALTISAPIIIKKKKNLLIPKAANVSVLRNFKLESAVCHFMKFLQYCGC